MPNVKTRREFMHQLAGAGVVGLSRALFPVWMPRLAFQNNRTQRDTLIVIFLRGGMDGLNVVVPFGEGANYYDKRPTLAIPEPGATNGAIDLNGFFGLHPALAPLADVYKAGQLGIVHATGLTHPTRSHFDAMEFMERGIPGDKTTPTGWINRHLAAAAWQNNSPFRAVGMGVIVPSSLAGPVSALALKSIADFHLNGREDQLAAAQAAIANLYAVQTPETELLRAQARDTFAVIDLLQKLSATEYVPANGATYPDSEFGLALKQTAQLIKADVGLEVSCIDLGGWDTHEEQGGVEGQMAQLIGEYAAGMAALYADLRDWWPNVTVVSMSEFGRRAEENASKGTDHGHGNCMFLLGGGVKGGIHTDWPTLAANALDDGDLAITIDYRDVLAEILTKRVLNPALDQVFPDYKPSLRGILTERGA